MKFLEFQLGPGDPRVVRRYISIFFEYVENFSIVFKYLVELVACSVIAIELNNMNVDKEKGEGEIGACEDEEEDEEEDEDEEDNGIII